MARTTRAWQWLVLVVAGLFIVSPAQAQIALDEVAPSVSVAGPRAPERVLSPIDVAPYLAEDEADAARKDRPWRFGVVRKVDVGLSTGGVWDSLPDGRVRWRHVVRSPGAMTLNLTFDRYDLPPGARLWVHTGDGSQTLGAFADHNNQASGTFATTLLPGDTVVLEYVEPADVPWPGELHLAEVTHGYRDVYGLFRDKAGGLKAFGSSFGCNNDANCAVGAAWEAQKRSVVMLVTGGSGFCTGALVNNAAGDGTPYVLTANHCLGGSVANWVFWFNWEAPTCGNPGRSPQPDTMSGAVLRARRSASDFALLELNNPVPASYDPYYAGIDATGAQPPSAVGIHHPAGDIKKISLEGSPLTSDSYGSGQGTHWRVNDWDDGTTEGGSSGSPLFHGVTGRIVGQLHGGDYGCNVTDWYGKTAVSWDGGNNAGSRLRDWLDPNNATGGIIDGYDPGAPTVPDDAALVGFLTPQAAVAVCGEVDPLVQLINRGTDPLTSVEVEVRLDGGPWTAVGTWTGTLATNALAEFALPTQLLAPGAHVLEARTRRPNGRSDGNAANDATQVSFESVDDSAVFPLVQGFEGTAFPPGPWRDEDKDGVEAWTRTDQASSEGAAAAVFDNFDEYAPGEEDRLESPRVDLADLTSATLTFDVAYARYDGRLYDGLRVEVQRTCGGPWEVVYDKEGSQLATVADVEDLYEPTGPGDWRTETIDLAPYLDEVVRVAFVNVSGWGNNLYLDDIRIDGVPLAGGMDTGEPLDTGEPVDTDVGVDTSQPDDTDGVDPTDSGDPADSGNDPGTPDRPTNPSDEDPADEGPVQGVDPDGLGGEDLELTPTRSCGGCASGGSVGWGGLVAWLALVSLRRRGAAGRPGSAG